MNVLLRSTGAGIDSRTIQPGQLFFALPGTQTDGSLFAAEALEKGAIAAVVSQDSRLQGSHGAYWPVENVLTTMQQLARDYRRSLDIPVMAITGSNGKTTNKNLLAAALRTRYRVHSTAGNFNNHIGLPLTILNAPRDTNFLLLEMGTNHFGEIATLCTIAEPDYGSILNVGKTHLEFLHSVEGVLRAKSELADFLYDHDGHLFLDLEEKSLDPLQHHVVDIIPFDRHRLPKNDFKVEVQHAVPDISLVVKSVREKKELILSSPLWGDHNVRNLIHALGVGSYFELDMQAMTEALVRYVPMDNRSQIVSWKGRQVYMDAYNANPTSMTNAIQSFRSAHPDAGVLVLGDMGELGETAIKEHEAILALIENLNFDQVWLVGGLFREAGEGRYSHFHFCPDVTSIDEKEIQAGNPILIKGSRSMALERLLND